MYYVYFTGETYLCARGPEFKDPFGELEDVKIYDYDDVKKWPDSALTFEARRVEVGKNYDPYAMVAIDGEKNRRDEKIAPPWFDDMDNMLDDFEQAEEDEDYENDWDEERKPIITPNDLTIPTMELIHGLAEDERKRWKNNGNPYDEKEMDRLIKEHEKGAQIRMQLMDSDLADKLADGIDPVEDMKIVAAHLMFLYAQERQIAEQEGRKPNEDFFYAGSNLYNFAAVEQKMDEDDDAEDWDEDDGEESLELMARLFSEHIQNADVDDQFVAELGEAADQFLTEKGFDLNSLAGLKAAQAWLENAKVEDAFYSEGPIENAIDWHVGEARIAAMLKVVKARIEKSMKK